MKYLKYNNTINNFIYKNYIKSNKIKDGKIYLDQILSTGNNSFNVNKSTIYALKGILEIYDHNIEKGNLFINKSLKLEPKNITALNTKAYIYLINNQINKAFNIYITCLDINSNHNIINKNIEFFKDKDNNINLIKTHLSPNLFLFGKKESIFRNKYVVLTLLITTIIFLSIKTYFNSYCYNYTVLIPKYKSEYFINISNIFEKKESIQKSKNTEYQINTIKLMLNSNIPIYEKIIINHKFREVIVNNNIQQYKCNKDC